MTQKERSELGTAIESAAMVLSRLGSQLRPLDDRDRLNCRQVVEMLDKAKEALYRES